DRARTERARAELHAALEPADDLVVGEELRGLVRDVVHVARAKLAAREKRLDLGVTILGTEVDVIHDVVAPRAVLPVDPERGAERRARVAGRGLHPDVAKDPGVTKPTVQHAVERDTAGHAKIRRTGFTREPRRELEHGLLEHLLQRACDVEMLRGEARIGFSRRPESFREARRLDS